MLQPTGWGSFHFEGSKQITLTVILRSRQVCVFHMRWCCVVSSPTKACRSWIVAWMFLLTTSRQPLGCFVAQQGDGQQDFEVEAAHRHPYKPLIHFDSKNLWDMLGDTEQLTLLHFGRHKTSEDAIKSNLISETQPPSVWCSEYTAASDNNDFVCRSTQQSLDVWTMQVERLQSTVRDRRAGYTQSLNVLRHAKQARVGIQHSYRFRCTVSSASSTNTGVACETVSEPGLPRNY